MFFQICHYGFGISRSLQILIASLSTISVWRGTDVVFLLVTL